MNKDKFIGICKVGEKGQIVIPKEVRNMFNIKASDNIVCLADINKGIALIKSETFEEASSEILNGVLKND